MSETLFSAFSDGDTKRQELVRTWLSHLLCDSRRLIYSVLLCHHSKDEQKVAKLKQSLQELGPVTVNSRDEGSATEGGGGFSEDLVIFCLSVEYVQNSKQVVRDKNTLMEGKNEVIYFMMEDNLKLLKKDLNSRRITKKTVFFFEEPDVPSIFKIYKRKKKGSFAPR